MQENQQKEKKKAPSYSPAGVDPIVSSAPPGIASPPYNLADPYFPFPMPFQNGQWSSPSYNNEMTDPKKQILKGGGNLGSYQDDIGKLTFAPYNISMQNPNQDPQNSSTGMYGDAALLNINSTLQDEKYADGSSTKTDIGMDLLKISGGHEYDPDSHYKVGGSASIIDLYLKNQNKTPIPGRDNESQISWGLGTGFEFGTYWGDSDKDGYPEYGFSTSLPFGLGLEMKSEDPYRDWILSALMPTNAITYDPTSNLTEDVNNLLSGTMDQTTKWRNEYLRQTANTFLGANIPESGKKTNKKATKASSSNPRKKASPHSFGTDETSLKGLSVNSGLAGAAYGGKTSRKGKKPNL